MLTGAGCCFVSAADGTVMGCCSGSLYAGVFDGWPCEPAASFVGVWPWAGAEAGDGFAEPAVEGASEGKLLGGAGVAAGMAAGA